MKKYDVFKSQGGYGVALGIYLDSPVVGTIRWFEKENDAIEYSKNKKRYDEDCEKFEDNIQYMTQEEVENAVYPLENDYNLDVGITI